MAKVNIAFDATMLDMFQLCPERFKNRFILNKESATKAKQLDRGSVIHTGFEYYYRALSQNHDYHYGHEAGLKAIQKALIESNLSDEDSRKVIRTYEENIDHWRIEDQRYKIKDVEKPFAYVIYEDDDVRMVMIGKIDLLVEDNRYSNLPVDHKSYDRDFPVPRLSNQFMNYCCAVESSYLLVNRVGFQQTLNPDQKHKRVMLSYDPLILEDWKQNTIKWLFYYMQCVAEDSWPMNFTSCDKFHRLCEYLDICGSSGIEAKMFKLTSNFRDAEKWDVSKILEKR